MLYVRKLRCLQYVYTYRHMYVCMCMQTHVRAAVILTSPVCKACMYTALHTSTVSTCVYLQSFLHGPQPSQLLLQFDTHLCTEQHKVAKQGRQHEVHRHSNCGFERSPSIHKYKAPFPARPHPHSIPPRNSNKPATIQLQQLAGIPEVGVALYGSDTSDET